MQTKKPAVGPRVDRGVRPHRAVARVHWHTKWLRQPAGEWRRFYPGAYGLEAHHGTSGASMRRQLRDLQEASERPC